MRRRRKRLLLDPLWLILGTLVLAMLVWIVITEIRWWRRMNNPPEGGVIVVESEGPLQSELLKQKEEAERANQETILEMEALKEEQKSERNETHLQALIYIHQIERLKKRIAELESK